MSDRDLSPQGDPPNLPVGALGGQPMTEPDRIWAQHQETFGSVKLGRWTDTVRYAEGGPEYIRADVHAAEVARLTELLRVSEGANNALRCFWIEWAKKRRYVANAPTVAGCRDD